LIGKATFLLLRICAIQNLAIHSNCYEKSVLFQLLEPILPKLMLSMQFFLFYSLDIKLGNFIKDTHDFICEEHSSLTTIEHNINWPINRKLPLGFFHYNLYSTIKGYFKKLLIEQENPCLYLKLKFY